MITVDIVLKYIVQENASHEGYQNRSTNNDHVSGSEQREQGGACLEVIFWKQDLS